MTSYEIRHAGSVKKALEYFDHAFAHYKESVRIYNEGNDHYTAPLVSGLMPVAKGELAPIDMGSFWIDKFKMLPDDLVRAIKDDPKYAECFA